MKIRWRDRLRRFNLDRILDCIRMPIERNINSTLNLICVGGRAEYLGCSPARDRSRVPWNIRQRPRCTIYEVIPVSQVDVADAPKPLYLSPARFRQDTFILTDQICNLLCLFAVICGSRENNIQNSRNLSPVMCFWKHFTPP